MSTSLRRLGWARREACLPVSFSRFRGIENNPPTTILSRFAAGLVIRDPMHRSAFALAANTGITSLLGFVYWVVAARRYSPSVVGDSSALLSALVILANVAELNLYNTLIRFLPTAGARSARYVLRAYITVAAMSVVVGLAALPLLRRLPLIDDLLELGPLGVTSFLMAVLVWCLFALQDSVAIGVRAAVWVPLENMLFGVAKVILLVALASSAPRLGIFASWSVAMLIILVPMNLLIFRRLIPHHAADSTASTEHVTGRDVAAFMTLDNLALIAATACTSLLPVIVAARAGSEANGYFFVAWVIGTAFDVALVNAAASLTVEGARDQDRLGALVRALTQRMVALAVPIVAIVLIAAPAILSLYGSSYATHSSDLLRLVALAVLPRIVVVIWMNINRIRRSVGRILLVQTVLSATVVGLSGMLVPRYGITAVGVVHLGAQSAAALILAPGVLRVLAYKDERHRSGTLPA